MKSKSGNYLKLTAHGPTSLYDESAASRAPNRALSSCTVSWVWPCATPGECKIALAAAQAKRKELRDAEPELSPEAFQLSTWRPSTLRGVPVVGVPRGLKVPDLAVAS